MNEEQKEVLRSEIKTYERLVKDKERAIVEYKEHIKKLKEKI